MTIVKEDGTGLANANSYADVADLASFAEDRGKTLPDMDADKEALLIQAMDYLTQFDDARRPRSWIGDGRATTTQALAWPRTGVVRDGEIMADDYMPPELWKAQCALALDAQDGDLMQTQRATDKGAVITERVEGAVTVQYANPGHVLPVANSAKADAFLRVLLKRNGLFAVRA